MMNCKIGLHCELCDGDCEHYQEMIPAKYGHWTSFLDGDGIMPNRYYRCSCCSSILAKNYPYCPFCGANMR